MPKRKHMEEAEIDPGSIPLPDEEDCQPLSTFPPLPSSPPPPPSPLPSQLPEYILEPESIPIPDTAPTLDHNPPRAELDSKSRHDLKGTFDKSSMHQRKKRPQDGVDETIVTLEDKEMSKLLGFSNFNTTKGKQVPGNNQVGAVHVVKKRRYRQYMNRKGGFNRPLDKVA